MIAAPCRLLPPGGAVSLWDRTAPLPPPPPLPPGPHITDPPAPSPPHYTAHQLLQGPGGLSGEQVFLGLGSRQPPTHEHTLALLDRAHLPLSPPHSVPAASPPPPVAGTLLTGLLV